MPDGKFSIIVSVWAMVSTIVKVNLNKYCRFTIIGDPVELDIAILFITFGDKLLTYVVHVSIWYPEIKDVMIIGSEGCSVGGDKKLFIEKLKSPETVDANKLDAVTPAVLSPLQRKVVFTF